jgi:putative addiction module killer protein
MFTVRVFRDERGKEPFMEWVNSHSTKTKDRIMERLYRLQAGNLGDHKRIGPGLFELRLFFDGGLRVYFGRDGDVIIVLLCGGDKKTQQRDINKAKEYWRRYHEQ